MEARLRTPLAKGPRDRPPIRQVGHDQRRRLVDVLAAAAREVVERDDVVSAGYEPVDHVRADEARSPCNERPHGAVS